MNKGFYMKKSSLIILLIFLILIVLALPWFGVEEEPKLERTPHVNKLSEESTNQNVSNTHMTNKMDETALDSLTHSDQTADDMSYLGTYQATLPCADCPGILTTLTLKADGTYELISDYIDRGKFTDSGHYTVVSGPRTISLTEDGRSFLILDDNTIEALDADGQPIQTFDMKLKRIHSF